VNSRLLVLGLSVLGIFMAFFMGRAAGQGQIMHIALVFGVMIGAPLLLSLGKNYWYLIPASLLSGLPAIPFGGRSINLAELCIALCFGIFVTRVAFKLDKILLWRTTHIPVYLFMAWVVLIFGLYPVGLAAFGAATIGGRFYAQLLLAFMAFIIIASREITEKDCKWIIIFILGGNIVNAVYSIGSYLLFGSGDEILNPSADTDGFYTWHQNLSVPAWVISFLLFSWKKPSEVIGFRNPLHTLVYLICICLALYSGKRMGIVAVLMAPLLGAILHKQFYYLFLGGIAALVFSLTIIFGHGDVFRLPLQMQRALSILPADWDREVKVVEGGQDPFRESLRRFAWENIERHPIIGRGFAIEYSEIIGQIMATRYIGGGDSQAAPFAIGRAWHNTWLGYAADFGIPLSLIQAILYLTVIIVTYKSWSLCPPKSLQKILLGYFFMFTFRDIFASHTSGHTAIDAYERWWMYAVIFSIYASVTARKKKFEPFTQVRTPMHKMFAGQSN
jgi:hypothetical protein